MNMEGVGPVSYTHLDVYKRQDYVLRLKRPKNKEFYITIYFLHVTEHERSDL